MCNMYKLELVLNTNLKSTDDMLHIYICKINIWLALYIYVIVLFDKLFLVFPQSHFMKVNNLVWQHELSLQINQNIAENITNCWSSPDGRRSDLLPSIRVWLGCYETHLQSHLFWSKCSLHRSAGPWSVC